MGSWYQAGYEGIAKEEQRIATASGPNRLWMPAGSKRELIFVDPEPIAIYEHQAKINGSWKNFFTCLRGIEDTCPGCEELGEKTRYYVGYYTAVDATGWTDKKGNKHQFEACLVPAKLKSLKKLKRKGQDRTEAGGEGLRGCLFSAARDDDKDPAIGSEFEYVRTVDLDKLFQTAMYKGKRLVELWDKAEADSNALVTLQKIFQVRMHEGKPVREMVPFNYMEVLKPLGTKDFRAAIKGADTGGDAVGADDVPF